MPPLYTSSQYIGKPELTAFKCLTAMLVWLLASVCVLGQVTKTQRTVEVEMITVEDGLPQGYVRGIMQDPTGFMWFNTKDGLARYDGYDFTVFRHNVNDPNSIPGNHTSRILTCQDGFFWFNIQNQGVGRYDPRTGSFVQAVLEDTSELWDKRVHILELAPDGTLWINTGKQLFYIDNPTNEQPKVKNYRAYHPKVPQAFGQVGAFKVDRDGRFWMVNGYEKWLHCYWLDANDSWHHQSWDLPIPKATEVLGSIPRLLLTLNSAKDQLIVSAMSKLYIFDTKTLSINDSISLPESNWVKKTIGIDSKGALLYLDLHSRFNRFDPVSKVLKQITLNPAFGESRRELYGLSYEMEDALGNKWGTTHGFGGIKLPRFQESFEVSRLGRSTDEQMFRMQYNLSGHHQHGFIFLKEAQKQDLHVASGLYSFRDTLTRQVWKPGPVDREGRLWGTMHANEPLAFALGYRDDEGILHRLDPVKDIPHILNVQQGYGDRIWLLVYDMKEPQLGVDRIVEYSTINRQVISSHQLPTRIPYGDYHYFQQFSLAPDSTIWMATPLGLFTLNLHDGHWRSFFHEPENTHSIPNNNVFSLCPDPVQPNDFMWVGTNGGGMAKMNKHTGHCEVYTQADGLPNNVIYSILSDSLDRLWISTNQGICQFNTRNGHIQNFTESDGLSGNEFNRHNSAISVDGRLIFGGVKGTTVIDPLDFQNETRASNTVITGLQLADGVINDSIIRYDPAYWFESDTYSPPTLTLAHDEPLLRIHFACLDHTSPERNEYRYRMVGQNDEWVNNGTEHYASFSNLPSGDYTFEVHGKNSNGIWDEEGARLAIHVLTPWYQSWWFRSIIFLTLASLVYAFYRYRIKQQVRLLELRGNIARDLHDEIGSTLSSVSMYAAVAQDNEDEPDANNSAILEKISDGTTNALEAMNDIVWAVNSDNDDLQKLTQRMNAFAIGLGEANGFDVELNIQNLPMDTVMEMGVRKEVYLVFKEAVNNAAKYASCKHLKISMHQQKNWIELTVSDDGKGFDPANIRPDLLGGNGLANMKQRATQIGGTLDVHSLLGEGTQITLRFHPKGKSLDPRTNS